MLGIRYLKVAPTTHVHSSDEESWFATELAFRFSILYPFLKSP